LGTEHLTAGTLEHVTNILGKTLVVKVLAPANTCWNTYIAGFMMVLSKSNSITAGNLLLRFSCASIFCLQLLGTVTGAVGTIKYSWKNASSIEVGTTASVAELACWNLYTNGF
jgi:hypothetical protein